MLVGIAGAAGFGDRVGLGHVDSPESRSTKPVTIAGGFHRTEAGYVSGDSVLLPLPGAHIGSDQCPTGFKGMQDLPAVTAELVHRGHSDETILKVLGGNYLRVFETVWGS